jgi:hypothetical protein
MKNTLKVVALFLVIILAMLVIPSSSKATDIPQYTVIKISVVVIGEDRTIEYEVATGNNLRKLGYGTIFGLNNQEFAEKYDGYYLDEACTEEYDIDEYFTDGLTLYVKALTTDDEQGTEQEPTTGDEQEPETEPTTDDEQTTEKDPTTEQDTSVDEQVTETGSVDEEKDSTPKTGVASYSGIVAVVALIALASIVVIKKRNA